jgi:hypothetical protein
MVSRLRGVIVYSGSAPSPVESTIIPLVHRGEGELRDQGHAP